MMLKGTAAWAVIGVNSDEPQSTMDGILTLGVLWLAYCREHGEGRRLFEGLKVVVPAGTSQTVRARMAWLNEKLAKWELYELDERAEQLARVDVRDCGNLRRSWFMHSIRRRHWSAAGPRWIACWGC